MNIVDLESSNSHVKILNHPIETTIPKNTRPPRVELPWKFRRFATIQLPLESFFKQRFSTVVGSGGGCKNSNGMEPGMV